MEDAKTLVKKLLADPYKSLLLRDYDKVMNNRRNRKKLEEIEKEVAWFNGKANNYKVEDRQGFFRHFQKSYGQEQPLMANMYRSVCDYPSGKEPKILYFVLLFEKRHQQMKEFQIAHPISDLKGSMSLAFEYKKLVNEYRLLAALLERLSTVVDGLEKSIDEHFTTDFLNGADKLGLFELQNRFLRASRLSSDPEVLAKLLEYIKAAGAKDTAYMDAMVCVKRKEFAEAVKYVEMMAPEHPNYKAAWAMALECCANTGNIKGFIRAFEEVKENKMDAMYFIYLLQLLVCNADYKELDSDEFESAVQNLLKNEFNQTKNPAFIGLVSRKFVSIMLEALPLTEKLTAIKKESGEEAIPEDELEKLYRLQMALQLYPVAEVGNLIDIDYMEEHGVKHCRQRLGRQVIAMLLEKNPDKSFENVYLTFKALEQVEMMDAYANNVETNLENLVKYAQSGQKKAYELIRKAHDYKAATGADVSKLAEVLAAAEN